MYVKDMRGGDSGFVPPTAIVREKPDEGLIEESANVEAQVSHTHSVYIECVDDGELIGTCSRVDENRFSSDKNSSKTYFSITLPSRL